MGENELERTTLPLCEDPTVKIPPDVKQKLELSDKFHLQPIAIRSRSSAESLTEARSPAQFNHLQLASTQDFGSARISSTGSNLLPTGRYDEGSDDSAEYWSDEEVLEGEESESNGERTRVVSDHQIIHLSQGYRERPHDGETERANGAVPKSLPKIGSPTSQGRKRVREGDQNQEGDEEDQKRRKSSDQVGKPLFQGRSTRFACPFFQRAPLGYQNEVCTGPGFKDIKSLKYFTLYIHAI